MLTQLRIDFDDTTKSQQIKQYSVTEISQLLKNTIEEKFFKVKIEGEVSGFKLASTGHGYFNVKDDNAILACTCWRPVMSRLGFKLEDGMAVVVIGKITTYSGMSRYQMTVEDILPSGEGALMAILKERKEKLTQEGLFDLVHKKPIPYLPKIIGVITSETGAVIKDILHRIEGRFPTSVILWPVSVQGQNCVKEILAALKGFNNMEQENRPDLLIVARGGGSIEDLWGFNDEEIVRAVFASKIPVISAIGHETDYTLIDFVSDIRAPTPTAAAEFAVPASRELFAQISHNYSSIIYGMSGFLKKAEFAVEINSNIIKSEDGILDNYFQSFDEVVFRLNTSIQRLLDLKQSKFNYIYISSESVQRKIDLKFIKIEMLFNELRHCVNQKLDYFNKDLDLNILLMQKTDFIGILKRGFALISKGGNRITFVNQLKSNDEILVKMFDGEIKAKVI